MDTEHGTYVNNIDDASALTVFKDYAGGDFSLAPDGGAFNAGTLTGLTLQPSVDLAGNPRVAFDKIDVGCYECQTEPSTLIIFH